MTTPTGFEEEKVFVKEYFTPDGKLEKRFTKKNKSDVKCQTIIKELFCENGKIHKIHTEYFDWLHEMVQFIKVDYKEDGKIKYCHTMTHVHINNPEIERYIIYKEDFDTNGKLKRSEEEIFDRNNAQLENTIRFYFPDIERVRAIMILDYCTKNTRGIAYYHNGNIKAYNIKIIGEYSYSSRYDENGRLIEERISSCSF